MQLLRKSEAASRLSISLRQLDLYISAGRIRVHRLGSRCVRVEEREIDRFIKSVSLA